MQASDRFNINSQLEHLQSKYVGTGHADLTYLYDEQNLNCASGAVHTIASVSARACGCVFVALRVIVGVCVCALAHTFGANGGSNRLQELTTNLLARVGTTQLMQ